MSTSSSTPTLTAVTVAVPCVAGDSWGSVRSWLAQADVDDGTRLAVSTEEPAEGKHLKAENERLREGNEILHRASTSFARELVRRNR